MIILTKLNRNNYYTINNEKRINLVIKYRNFIFRDYYYCEYKNFKYYYMTYYYAFYKLCKIGYFNYSGNYHREYGHGPAKILYNENGKIKVKEYFLNGKKYYYGYFLKIKK